MILCFIKVIFMMLSACDMVGCLLCYCGLVCVVCPFLLSMPQVVLVGDSCLLDTMKFVILLLICLGRFAMMFALSLAFSFEW